MLLNIIIVIHIELSALNISNKITLRKPFIIVGFRSSCRFFAYKQSNFMLPVVYVDFLINFAACYGDGLKCKHLRRRAHEVGG